MSTTTVDRPFGGSNNDGPHNDGPQNDLVAGFGSGPKVPLTRLVRVELRKMVDTRAGLWLMVAIALITVAILIIFFANASTSDRTFLNFMGIMATPQGILLPILGILLVTQEWGQRTGMVTFTLTPHRGQVILAKVTAALLLGLIALAGAVLLGALATVLGGYDQAWQGIGPDDVAKFALLEVTGVLQGLAFGLLFLNSGIAIVVYLVLPNVFALVASLWHPLERARDWVDLTASQPLLYSGDHLSATDWAHLASGIGIWVLLPFVLGLVHVLRAEVK